jgi:hypothetical protein
MSDTVLIYGFDGITQGLSRAEVEILRDWLFTERRLAWAEFGGKVRKALEAGMPLELTLNDVPVLRAVLDNSEVGDFEGLAALSLAVGAEPVQQAA